MKEFRKTELDYIQMQKSHYEDSKVGSAAIVGNYHWHEQYPYETFLLYKYGDIRLPVPLLPRRPSL